MDTQVKVYRDELSELKESLSVEVNQLRNEFQELKTTLQQQHEDVTASLKNLGLQDVSEDAPKEAEAPKGEENDDEVQALPDKDNEKDSEH